MTEAGVILGTAAYMAPEQASGPASDRRVDVWAFGCVLFKMLTGRRAFAGDSFADVLGAVVRARPGLDTAAGRGPSSLARLTFDESAGNPVSTAVELRFDVAQAWNPGRGCGQDITRPWSIQSSR